MLSGCPSCGGNRFQFIPDGAPAADEPAPQEDDIIAPDPEPGPTLAEFAEDRAQVDARSSVVDETELPPAPTSPSPSARESAPTDATEQSKTDLGELRQELEDRFESIKIVDRGEYELNLMELYERPECIIELGENGRYAIHVPETLTESDA